MIELCCEYLSVRCTWLYVLIMSHTHFRVNPHSILTYELSGCGFESSHSHLNFRSCSCFEQGVPWLSGNYRLLQLFTLKHIHDMIRTYIQMHHADKCSQHSSIILPVWLNGWVFVYELSSCGFKSSCSHFANQW